MAENQSRKGKDHTVALSLYAVRALVWGGLYEQIMAKTLLVATPGLSEQACSGQLDHPVRSSWSDSAFHALCCQDGNRKSVVECINSLDTKIDRHSVQGGLWLGERSFTRASLCSQMQDGLQRVNPTRFEDSSSRPPN